MAKKQNPMSPERKLVVSVACVPIVMACGWMAWPQAPGLEDPPHGYASVCPGVPGQPLGILAVNSVYVSPENRPSYTRTYERYTAYDLDDGTVVGRADLGSHKESNSLLECMASEGDRVWIRSNNDGVHLRDARSGAMVTSRDELLAGITAPVDKLWFDGKRLIVATTDGRQHFVEPKAPPRGQQVAWSTSHEQSSAGLVKRDGTGRAAVLVGGKPLAETDWLDPQYAFHPSGGVIWPDPPSLIICERTSTDTPHRQVSRVGLDGTIWWTYTPGAMPARVTSYCPWTPSADGRRLILPTAPNGLVAIDTGNGREVLRRVQ